MKYFKPSFKRSYYWKNGPSISFFSKLEKPFKTNMEEVFADFFLSKDIGSGVFGPFPSSEEAKSHAEVYFRKKKVC